MLEPRAKTVSVDHESAEVRMRPQPLIAVSDVEASSRWYQQLLGCRSAHGGAEYERLVSDAALILQLHRWDIEHHHGPIGDPGIKPYGNACCSGSKSTISTPPLPVRSR